MSLPRLIFFSDPEFHPEKRQIPWEGLPEPLFLHSHLQPQQNTPVLLPASKPDHPHPRPCGRVTCHVLLTAGFVSTKDAEHLRTRVVPCSPRIACTVLCTQRAYDKCLLVCNTAPGAVTQGHWRHRLVLEKLPAPLELHGHKRTVSELLLFDMHLYWVY